MLYNVSIITKNVIICILFYMNLIKFYFSAYSDNIYITQFTVVFYFIFRKFAKNK